MQRALHSKQYGWMYSTMIFTCSSPTTMTVRSINRETLLKSLGFNYTNASYQRASIYLITTRTRSAMLVN